LQLTREIAMSIASKAVSIHVSRKLMVIYDDLKWF
jgi:hypothetical protein